MGRDVDLVDFENLLILKNQLITLTTESLEEVYKDVSDYIIFVDTVICMLNNESAFLYISDSFVKKIECVLQIHRFDIKNKEVFEAINEITKCLNQIKCTNASYRKLLVSNYMEYQKNIRKCSFGDINDLLYSLSYDAIAYVCLQGKEKIVEKDELLLASINYMLEEYPKIFEDIKMHDMTKNKLDSVSKRSNIFALDMKIISSQAKKKLKSIRINEE